MELEMTEHTNSVASLKRAQKHVKRLKAWYWMIPTNLFVTATLGTLSFLMHHNGEPNTIIWILMSSAMGLWVIFIIEGIVLNKLKVVRSWEERQIKKLIKQNKLNQFY